MTKSQGSGDPLKGAAGCVEILEKICHARPTAAFARARSAKSADTIRKIIAAADLTFRRQGYRDLALRDVAQEAGIALGNLTYHFPNKEDLVRAVLQERQAMFAQACLEKLGGEPDKPFEALKQIVLLYVEDARASDPIFFQIWGYAGAGAAEQEFIADIYKPLSQVIAGLIAASNPTLDADTAHRKVFQLTSLVEGARALIGIGADATDASRLDNKDLTALAEIIVFDGAPPPQ